MDIRGNEGERRGLNNRVISREAIEMSPNPVKPADEYRLVHQWVAVNGEFLQEDG